jgi:hypothetical protein
MAETEYGIPHIPTDADVLARHQAAVTELATYWWGRDAKGDAGFIARQSVQALVNAGLLPAQEG